MEQARLMRSYDLKNGQLALWREGSAERFVAHFLQPNQWAMQIVDANGTVLDAKKITEKNADYACDTLKLSLTAVSFEIFKARINHFIHEWRTPLRTTALCFIVVCALLFVSPFAFAPTLKGAGYNNEAVATHLLATGNNYVSASDATATIVVWLIGLFCLGGCVFFTAALVYLSAEIARADLITALRSFIPLKDRNANPLLGTGSKAVASLPVGSGQNIIVYQNPGESRHDFNTRVKHEVEALDKDLCLLVVRYQNPVCHVWHKGKVWGHGQLSEIGIKSNRVDPATAESETQYMELIKELPVNFDNWAFLAMASIDNDEYQLEAKIDSIKENSEEKKIAPIELDPTAKTTVNCALVLFFVLSGFATTAQAPVSEQLRTLIGMVEYESAAKSGVMLEIQPPKQLAQQINIPASGTVANTVEKNPALNALESKMAVWLLSAKVNGKEYAKLSAQAPKPVEVRQTEPVIESRPTLPPSNDMARQMRPNGVRAKIEPTKDFISDSLGSVEYIERQKGVISWWMDSAKSGLRPWWAFGMWLFDRAIIFLICIGGVFRYLSQTAASESAVNIYGRIIVGRWIAAVHQNTAAALLLITWTIVIVLLLDVFMRLMYWNLPLWLMIATWFPILFFAEKFTNWIVPNIKVIGPGR